MMNVINWGEAVDLILISPHDTPEHAHTDLPSSEASSPPASVGKLKSLIELTPRRLDAELMQQSRMQESQWPERSHIIGP